MLIFTFIWKSKGFPRSSVSFHNALSSFTFQNQCRRKKRLHALYTFFSPTFHKEQEFVNTGISNLRLSMMQGMYERERERVHVYGRKDVPQQHWAGSLCGIYADVR